MIRLYLGPPRSVSMWGPVHRTGHPVAGRKSGFSAEGTSILRHCAWRAAILVNDSRRQIHGGTVRAEPGQQDGIVATACVGSVLRRFVVTIIADLAAGAVKPRRSRKRPEPPPARR